MNNNPNFYFLIKDIKDFKKRGFIKCWFNNNCTKESRQYAGTYNIYETKQEYKGYVFNLRVQYLKDVEMDIYIESINTNEIINCALIMVNLINKSAILQSLNGNINCAEPKLPIIGKGTILMDFIKNSITKKLLKRFNIKYIDVDDNSKVYCNPNKKQFRFDYSKLYSLMSGMPWYYKFGFNNLDNEVNEDIKYNINIINQIKVNEINFDKLLILIYDDNIKNKIEYINKNIDKLRNYFNSNLLLKNVIRKMFSDDCELLYYIYNDIYRIIKLINISDNNTVYRYYI